IFRQDGYKVAPFKAQNMALNSAITSDGGEIGRAQALQALAAGIEPTVDMNPVLLKANSDMGSQVIIRGKVAGNMSAREYFSFKAKAWDVICDSYKRLSEEYDLIVIEGAGSPAEINLEDIVNMKVARMADAPVILVGDIDRGGLFASIVGTMELLSTDDRKRVAGFIINKFRGDESLLAGGIAFIEERYGIPIVATIPYLKGLGLPEEDGVALDRSQESGVRSQEKIDIFVIRLPHISNFTDFDPFKFMSDVSVRYVTDPSEFSETDRVDLVIIPGSKNTIDDLAYLIESGMAEKIKEFYKLGGRVIGICGGYQMLGRTIDDPLKIETTRGMIEGLGLLPVETILEPEKITSRVKAELISSPLTPHPSPLTDLSGYEIHMGRTRLLDGARPIFRIFERSGEKVDLPDGAISRDRMVWGTYIHGIFDNDSFRHQLLEEIRRSKGVQSGILENYSAHLEANLNKLASLVRERIDLSRIGLFP
ncbi:MAG TPA: cobyric acid synthase, partial [Nitrospiria bacterium]|nr:cobyric acid synthase [Nitrospiria bacterium]